MTIKRISEVLHERALQRYGIVGSQGFGVDQGPFEESGKKYVAYQSGNYNGDFYFDTLDEFLEGFVINGRPIGEQIDNMTEFYVVMS